MKTTPWVKTELFLDSTKVHYFLYFTFSYRAVSKLFAAKVKAMPKNGVDLRRLLELILAGTIRVS